jgi:hypothetical protein
MSFMLDYGDLHATLEVSVVFVAMLVWYLRYQIK